MNGRQSFVMNEIKDEIRQGRDVTHVLNVKISRQGEEGTGDRIRKAIFQRVANRAIPKRVEGQQVTITWKTSATKTSAYYYCDSPFTNRYVIGHTKILLRDILNDIDATFNNVFTRHETGVAFLVTNPALYRIPAPDQFEEVAVEEEHDEEVDIEQEHQ